MDTPLKRWRKAHGFTQTDLAKKLGKTKDTVSRWERRKHLPHGVDLRAVMKLTGLSADDILVQD